VVEGVEMTVKILVAEDNHINQKIISSILGEFRYEFDIVDNGGKAFEAVRNGGFDLVLMDLEMPEMDGLEATLWIRDQVSKKIPIIAVTANAEQWRKKEIIKAGMNAVIAKPLCARKLVEAINGQLGIGLVTPEESASAPNKVAAYQVPEINAEMGLSGLAAQKAEEQLSAIAKITDDAGDTIVSALENIEKAVIELQNEPDPSRYFDLCNAIEMSMMDAMQACSFTDLVAQKVAAARQAVNCKSDISLGTVHDCKIDGEEACPSYVNEETPDGKDTHISQDDIDSLFD